MLNVIFWRRELDILKLKDLVVSVSAWVTRRFFVCAACVASELW